MNESSKNAGISGALLKHIAIICMFIDHFGFRVIGGYLASNNIPSENNYPYVISREVGRIAFPLFCFLIAQGAVYTKSRLKYLISLLIFAVISEIPFNLINSLSVRYPAYQNVYFTLTLGLLLICIFDRLTALCKDKKMSVGLSSALFVITFIVLCGAAFFSKSDYGFTGVILIFLLYILRYEPNTAALPGIFIMTLLNGFECWLQSAYSYRYVPPFSNITDKALSEFPVVIAFLLITMYNGKRGRQLPKYLYYAFYPAHLLFLWMIRDIL